MQPSAHAWARAATISLQDSAASAGLGAGEPPTVEGFARTALCAFTMSVANPGAGGPPGGTAGPFMVSSSTSQPGSATLASAAPSASRKDVRAGDILAA